MQAHAAAQSIPLDSLAPPLVDDEPSKSTINMVPASISLGIRLTSGSHNRITLRRRRQNIEHSHLPAAICINHHHKCGGARKK